MSEPDGLYRSMKEGLKQELQRLDQECFELIRALEARLELMNVLVDTLKRGQETPPPASED